MRDLLILSIVIGALFLAFKRPYVGALLWAWLSIMNPHRYAYGFSFTMPLAMLAAVVTLVSLLVNREQLRKIPSQSVIWIWLLFYCWMVITTLGAYYVDESLEMLNKVTKITLMMFVTMFVVVEKRQINLLIWVYVMSIGLLGLKGGIFTITSGGAHRVWGPPGSYIAGNNEIGLAFVVVVPLLYYLTFQTKYQWLKYLTFACAAGSAVSAFGSQSRGAFLAIAAMSVFLWLKADRKLPLGILLVAGGLSILAFMPESWHSRMDTIQTYQEDASSMGRLNAWMTAYNIASDNFLGAGFEAYKATPFARYRPNPEMINAAHSIYFQVLGEHGFVGLALYLLFWIFSWRLAGMVHRRAAKDPALDWIRRFAAMAKVSMVGFAVGGAFLSLAYFDLPYYLTATLVVMARWIDMRQEACVGGQPGVSSPARNLRSRRRPVLPRADDGARS